jgi:hypothetical protein
MTTKRKPTAKAVEYGKKLVERLNTPEGAKDLKNARTVTVEVQCIMCKTKRDIKAGEIAPGDHPMCNKCFGPMVPTRAHG